MNWFRFKTVNILQITGSKVNNMKFLKTFLKGNLCFFNFGCFSYVTYETLKISFDIFTSQQTQTFSRTQNKL